MALGTFTPLCGHHPHRLPHRDSVPTDADPPLPGPPPTPCLGASDSQVLVYADPTVQSCCDWLLALGLVSPRSGTSEQVSGRGPSSCGVPPCGRSPFSPAAPASVCRGRHRRDPGHTGSLRSPLSALRRSPTSGTYPGLWLLPQDLRAEAARCQMVGGKVSAPPQPYGICPLASPSSGCFLGGSALSVRA